MIYDNFRKVATGLGDYGLSKVRDLVRKVTNEKLNKVADLANIFRKMLKDEFNKRFRVSGITLTNNEMESVVKVVTPLDK